MVGCCALLESAKRCSVLDTGELYDFRRKESVHNEEESTRMSANTHEGRHMALTGTV